MLNGLNSQLLGGALAAALLALPQLSAAQPAQQAPLLPPAAGPAPGTGLSPGHTVAPMVERVLPAVVNISTRGRARAQRNPLMDDPLFRRFFEDLFRGGQPEEEAVPDLRETQSLGSGVIINAELGHVITNYHVIEDADDIHVTLRDQRRFRAEVIGTDPETDIALLRIDADDLTELPLADVDDLRVGDFVVAVGNPFGLSQTVTYGIVSALGRSGLGIEGYESFIQTDASINPGHSGGPLVDLSGDMVGINTAIVGPSGGNVGVGFAIPANMVKAVVAQLAEHGEVNRGQLGVMIQDLTPDIARAIGIEPTRGALVSRVLPGSPAERAGIEAGDVVTSIDGRPIRNSSMLRNAVGMLRQGETVSPEVVRGEDTRTLSIALGERGAQAAAPGRPGPGKPRGSTPERLGGATLGAIPEDHPLAGSVEGVAVLDVERGSTAWTAGLREGDVITSIGRQPVTSLTEAEQALEQGDGPVLLNVRREDGALFLVVG